MSPIKSIALWILIWIPLSFMFPNNVHLPHIMFAPIFGPLFFLNDLKRTGILNLSFTTNYHYLPAFIFWVGGAIFVLIASKFIRINKKIS